MKKTLLSLILAVLAATATAQTSDSTSLRGGMDITPKKVKLFRVLAGTSITVYSFQWCFNKYAPPQQGAGGYWLLDNYTFSDMIFVCEEW